MSALEAGQPVKYLGPSAGCANPERHGANPGMVGVIVEIVRTTDDGHDVLVQSAMDAEEWGYARPDEVAPFDEWDLSATTRKAEKLSLSVPPKVRQPPSASA